MPICRTEHYAANGRSRRVCEIGRHARLSVQQKTSRLSPARSALRANSVLGFHRHPRRYVLGRSLVLSVCRRPATFTSSTVGSNPAAPAAHRHCRTGQNGCGEKEVVLRGLPRRTPPWCDLFLLRERAAIHASPPLLRFMRRRTKSSRERNDFTQKGCCSEGASEAMSGVVRPTAGIASHLDRCSRRRGRRLTDFGPVGNCVG